MCIRSYWLHITQVDTCRPIDFSHHFFLYNLQLMAVAVFDLCEVSGVCVDMYLISGTIARGMLRNKQKFRNCKSPEIIYILLHLHVSIKLKVKHAIQLLTYLPVAPFIRFI